MPVPESSIVWWMPLVALCVIALTAFLVSWISTDLLHVPRAVYLATLMVVTALLTWGYLAWSGSDWVAFARGDWGWGVVGALVSGGIGIWAITAAAHRRGLPPPRRRGITAMTGALVWEGLLYGAAEGLLLSVLPVLAAWQAFDLLGWTESWAGALGAGVLAIAASVLVIWVHHLGYREFRATREIVMPILGCGVLSVAYLLTTSPLAAVGGHILLHAGMEVRGVPMPPYAKLAEAPPHAEPVMPVAA
jgi:hypothetical protein